MFEACENEILSKDQVKYKIQPKKAKAFPFLVNGRSLYIRKTTAVWLLQEGERVSTDRLFRVRNKQPFSSDNLKPTDHDLQSPGIEKPGIADTIQIGQCVFL